jgi:hypothetical protein
MASLAALLVSIGVPGTAAAELKSIWGPNVLPNGHSAFPTYQKLGVDVLQRQLTWNTVAPTRPKHPRNPHDPAYHWPATTDGAAVETRRHGMRLALMIKGSPRWANGGRDPGWAPLNPRDVANFAIAASRHYYHVRLWMVWGEPGLKGNFAPMAQQPCPGAQLYARVLDRTYAALKSVRRSNIVIGGMSFDGEQPGLPQYLQCLRLPNGKPPRLDWFGHNPYPVRYPDLSLPIYNPVVRDISDVDTYVQEIRQVYRSIHRRPKLWLSEWNVQSDHPTYANVFYVSRRAQARWLTAGYRIAHSQRYVAGCGWFELLDQSGQYGLTGGLMTAKGKRKPAWYAYKRAR